MTRRVTTKSTAKASRPLPALLPSKTPDTRHWLATFRCSFGLPRLHRHSPSQAPSILGSGPSREVETNQARPRALSKDPRLPHSFLHRSVPNPITPWGSEGAHL